jgi:hypothetical protein
LSDLPPSPSLPHLPFLERAQLGQEAASLLEGAKAVLGLTHLRSVRVAHCAHAYGLVLEGGAHDAGGPWKLAFSGDTMPCEAMVEAARGATLLIHEATFDDSMEEEAAAKRHCTTGQAVRSAAASGAYRTLLTHFSQRYPKVPVIDDAFQVSSAHQGPDSGSSSCPRPPPTQVACGAAGGADCLSPMRALLLPGGGRKGAAARRESRPEAPPADGSLATPATPPVLCPGLAGPRGHRL